MRERGRGDDVHERLIRCVSAPKGFFVLWFIVGVCAAWPALGRASKKSACKPRPLSVMEAQRLLEQAWPHKAGDRKAGLHVQFSLDHQDSVWYTFAVEATPAPKGLVIVGHEAVNRYTADVVDPVLLCKRETWPKLPKLQDALRRSHCLGPATLKKYRDPKRFPCLN
jgi:hypothetical protein